MVSTGTTINVGITVIMAVTGSLGNLLIILSFLRVNALWTVNNIFILQFSISDFVKTTFTLTYKAYNQAQDTTELKSAICPITGMITTIGFTQPVLALSAIALVRYFKVCKPWLFEKIFTMSKAKWYCVGIFGITFLLSLLPLSGVGIYAYSKYHGVCFTDWRPENTVFRSLLYVFTMGIPYPILIYCYVMIFKTLRQHGKNISASFQSIPAQSQSESEEDKPQGKTLKPNNNTLKPQIVSSRASVSENVLTCGGPAVRVMIGAKKYKMSQMEIQVTKVMFVIVVAYTICWLPPCIATFMTLGGFATPDSVLITIVTLADLKSCLNPFIYGIGSRQFRDAFKSLFKICKFSDNMDKKI